MNNTFIDRRVITTLPIEDWSILHAIRFSKTIGNLNIPGEILYERKLLEYKNMRHSSQIQTSQIDSFDNEYNFSDKFDVLLLEALKSTYSHAQSFSKVIGFNSQRDEIKYKLKRPKQKVQFIIIPLIDCSEINKYEGRELIQYNIPMNLYADWIDANVFTNECYYKYYDFSECNEIEEIMRNTKYIRL